MERTVNIGVAGTGFIARGLVYALESQDDLTVASVLTRRQMEEIKNFPDKSVLTNNVEQFIESSDLIVECSGDVIHGTAVIDKAISASLPVITMNSELQITTGSYFARRGFITEAEGDQPGSLAALKENVEQMGFKPLVYGNIKGFLNTNPSREDMLYWAERNGISLQMVTSFTDGTKVQIEQALAANGLQADIAAPGLLGFKAADINQGGTRLANEAARLNRPISDYLLCPKGPAGVFITATHDDIQQQPLSYLKMGEGPYYTLVQTFHLCHLEIMKTIRRVLNGEGVLLNNTASPSISVAAIAKRKLFPGDKIIKGIGSFEVRGEAVKMKAEPEHIPIGLIADATVTRVVEEGQILTFSDAELPESLALKAWREVAGNALIME
ncbi:NAD(P)-dependent oxidoreductase [Salipaludibacillus sp. CUR1]|uniref:NAD(P)-dependent oxidoreductase n=1 Tax=Salipaludibacillus sp. CUR1 TaxID=2820003 RepID=UPI001E2CFA23|nr:NAD(P)-dependent oxidoreductase [Salipaludibacillus sp. CUR1]MCE7792513.1 NAD(P)-dependent oxidoreductase [Salipaludibacillus sp. CUR1]